MYMKRPIIVMCFCCLFLLSCASKQKEEKLFEQKEINHLPVLDIAGNLSTSIPDTFTWNSIAKSIQLIPLGTKEPLGRTPIIADIQDSLIFISEVQTQSANIFDLRGEMKSSFRKVGQGPGEYIHFTYLRYNKSDSSITVFDNNGKLLKYSLTGKCIDEKNLKNRAWGNIVHIDTLNTIYTKNGSESSGLVSVLNEYMQAENNYFMYDSTDTDRYKAGFYLMCNRSNTRDKYLINTPLNDTLYSVKKTMLEPCAVLLRGSHSLTEQVLNNSIMKFPPENDLITYTSVDLFSDFLLYRYYWNGQFYIQLWNLNNRSLMGKVCLNQLDQLSGLQGGFNFVFESGRKLRLIPNYISDRYLGFIIPAQDCVAEIAGVKEDDNPVILLIQCDNMIF